MAKASLIGLGLLIVHSMKGTGIALVAANGWSLMEGDELVHVSGGPSPFALNVQVSGTKLGCGRHVLVAAQLEHSGYKSIMIAGNAESTAVIQGKKVADELERLSTIGEGKEKENKAAEHDLERKQALLAELAEWSSDRSSGNLLLARAKVLRENDSNIRLTHTEVVIGLARVQRSGVFYRRSSTKQWFVEARLQGGKTQFPKLFHVLHEGKPNPDHWRYLVFLEPKDVVTTSDFVPIHLLTSKASPSDVPSSTSLPP
jgi:hypothetical protein